MVCAHLVVQHTDADYGDRRGSHDRVQPFLQFGRRSVASFAELAVLSLRSGGQRLHPVEQHYSGAIADVVADDNWYAHLVAALMDAQLGGGAAAPRADLRRVGMVVPVQVRRKCPPECPLSAPADNPALSRWPSQI